MKVGARAGQPKGLGEHGEDPPPCGGPGPCHLGPMAGNMDGPARGGLEGGPAVARGVEVGMGGARRGGGAPWRGMERGGACGRVWWLGGGVGCVWDEVWDVWGGLCTRTTCIVWGVTATGPVPHPITVACGGHGPWPMARVG